MVLKEGASGRRFWVIVGLSLMMALATSIPLFAAPTLTTEEQTALRYIYEEEKLARDVYTVLYDKWQLKIFYNIKQSEQNHMDAMKNLLDYYKVPYDVKGPGVFTDKYLQEAYDSLVSTGLISVVEALNVGVTIEETDIVDLDFYLGNFTYKNIVNVYKNLKAASLNHLDAFETQLGN